MNRPPTSTGGCGLALERRDLNLHGEATRRPVEVLDAAERLVHESAV